MKYYGIEIFDGKIYSDFPLEENEPLESQWMSLGNDVGGIIYEFMGFGFCIDILWSGDVSNVYKSGNEFSIRIFEGERTEGKTFYLASIDPDLKKLKEGMQKAVDFIQTLKKMPEDEILNYPAIPYCIDVEEEDYDNGDNEDSDIEE
jgi:hypothetical protein